MADRPITFSGPMVRALLAGTKTQTRRIFPHSDDLESVGHQPNGGWSFGYRMHYDPEVSGYAKPPRIAVGDRLYVREHWRTFVSLDEVAPRDLLDGTRGAGVLYEADDGGMAMTAEGNRTYGQRESRAPFGKFRQAMHMPKWASRLTLHVTEVRVQRLQEISPADAIAEGIELVRETAQWGKHWRNYGAEGYDDRSPIYSYRTLWNSLRGHTGEHQLPVEPWSENPWVTATTFEVERCHIDQARAA